MQTRKTDLRTTMTDVARLAGVSQSCVSLVLNDVAGTRLSEQTRQRVRHAAAELGYTLPRRVEARPAPGPAMPERRTIAFVVDEISISPHPVSYIDGTRDAAWARGVMVDVHVTRGDAGLEAATLRAIAANPSVLGVVYASSFMREVAPVAGFGPRPLVLVNCYTPSLTQPILLPGEVAGGTAVTRHLIEQGHRRIALVGGEPWMDASRDRLAGYRAALSAAGLAFDPALVRDGNWSAGSGYRIVQEVVALQAPPTALFCANDRMAIGALEALREAGLAVPQDVSVVGYNDLELAQHLHPPLSSCRLPNYELGSRAAELLLEAVECRVPPAPLLIEIACQLVIRGSTAPPASVRIGASRRAAVRRR